VVDAHKPSDAHAHPKCPGKKRGFQVERGNQSMLGKKKSNPTSGWDEPTVQAQSPSPIIVEGHAS